MNKLIFAIPAILLALSPMVVLAHEHDTFKIGTSYYQFVVGSLNEPIVVDDKTGLDLTVTKCFSPACAPTRGEDGDMDGPAGTPVTDLESTLKVEMIAADQKQLFELSPQWGKSGSYKTTFYPTIATTITYRIIGTLNEVPVDLSFTCVPEGVTRAADDSKELKMSDSVIRTSHGGAFGCPMAKEDLGFPKTANSIDSLYQLVTSAKSIAQAALAVGVMALLLCAVSLRRKN